MAEEGNRDIVTFTYVNHKGHYSNRIVRPVRLWFGSTAWHPEPQWLLEAVDLQKVATRDFAMSGVSGWEVVSNKTMEDIRGAVELRHEA